MSSSGKLTAVPVSGGAIYTMGRLTPIFQVRGRAPISTIDKRVSMSGYPTYRVLEQDRDKFGVLKQRTRKSAKKRTEALE
jgi:hypothetical protein